MKLIRTIFAAGILALALGSGSFAVAASTPTPRPAATASAAPAATDSPVVTSVAPAGGVTIGGRVYNGGSEAGFSGVQIMVCGYGVATTDADGKWQIQVPAGNAYCARIFGGAPADLVGPKLTGPNSNVDTAQISSYENQVAGRDCIQEDTCTSDQNFWDGADDTGLDFIYGPGKVLAAGTTAQPSKPRTLFGHALPKFTIPNIKIAGFNLPSNNTLIDGLVVGAAALFVIMLILFAPIRRKQKQTYEEYIRAKYYNL